MIQQASTHPLITVLTVCLNHAEFLNDAIASVLTQEYPSVQHIVIDGGSTDRTIEILKSHSHLEWISEPDNGVSDALNKGFKRAKGEFIVWLNADDFLLPGTLNAIAEAPKGTEIILGQVKETDRGGKPIRVIENQPRSFGDLLRYWIPNSFIAQPGIFLSRSFLESIKLGDGNILDETFRYAMDYDLWLRVFALSPSVHYINRPVAAFRTYGENLTGRGLHAPQREMSRAYRRALNKTNSIEVPLMAVIPTLGLTPELKKSVEPLVPLTSSGFGIHIVHYEGGGGFKELQGYADSIIENTDNLSIVTSQCRSSDFFKAINYGINRSASPLLAILVPGTTVGADTVSEAIKIFSRDSIACAFFYKGREDLLNSLVLSKSGGAALDPNGLIELTWLMPPIIVRNKAITELGGFRFERSVVISFRDLLFRLSNRGWGIRVQNGLSITALPETDAEEEVLKAVFKEFAKATVLVEAFHDSKKDAFYPVRASSGGVPIYSEGMMRDGEAVLRHAPPSWGDLEFLSSFDSIKKVTVDFPAFTPGWYFLASTAESLGETAIANNAKSVLSRLLA